MPSSTSSSDGRLVPASYLRIWTLGACLLLVMLGSSEALWRRMGYWPNVVDTKMFWCLNRRRADSAGGKRVLVIAGASRAQVGIDPAVLQRVFPEFQVVHLAIEGTSPLAVIRDLAMDEKFDGVILASATVGTLFPFRQGVPRRDKEYVEFFRNGFRSGAALEKRANTRLAVFLQSRWVIFSPVLTFRSLLAHRLRPKKLYQHMDANRFRPAFYRERMTAQELGEHRQRRIDRVAVTEKDLVSAAEFERFARGDLKQLYGMLRARGGDMVLVRMPTTDEHWELDEKMAPKARFWDRIQEWTGIATIHFLDHPELSRFACPDTSHLDATDAGEFTLRLGRLVHALLADLGHRPSSFKSRHLSILPALYNKPPGVVAHTGGRIGHLDGSNALDLLESLRQEPLQPMS